MSVGSGRLATRLDDAQSGPLGLPFAHQLLLFVGFLDGQTGRSMLADIATEITSVSDLADPSGSTSVNLGLSVAGLTVIAAPGVSRLPLEFQMGMAARSELIGDVGRSAPTEWTGPYSPGAAAVHAVIVIAADTSTALDRRTRAVRRRIADGGGSEVAIAQHGHARPGPAARLDHLGTVLIGPVGERSRADVAPLLVSGGDAASLPWTAAATYLVYRRLRQDVAVFHRRVANRPPEPPTPWQAAVPVVQAGIAYGPEFVATEPAYPPSGSIRNARDRGWLLLCYQSSIASGFETVQHSRGIRADRGDSCVSTTGGGYFILPSRQGLAQLSS